MGGRGASYGKQSLFDWLANEGAGKGKAQPMDVAKYQGWTLEQIERYLRGLGHEELFALDKDGNVIAAYKGGKTSVSFPVDLLQVDGATVTHGHPKSAEDFGGTFSFADMKNMLTSSWAEHRATASGQGEMNYILRATSRANSKGFYNQINKDYTSIKSQMSDKYDSAYKSAIKSGASKQQALHRARQEAVGVLNRYYKDTASKFGYEYITRKEDYTYNR